MKFLISRDNKLEICSFLFPGITSKIIKFLISIDHISACYPWKLKTAYFSLVSLEIKTFLFQLVIPEN
jgi:hypothetical protein